MTAAASFWGFLRVLVRARTRSLRTLVPWLLLAAVAGTLGWSFSTEAMRQADSSAMQLAGLSWLGILFGVTTVLVAGFGVISSIELVCRDTELEWLPPLFAAGCVRWTYTPAAAITLLAEAILVYGILFICLLTPVRMSGYEPGVYPLEWLVGGGAFVVASSAYGLGLGVLIRRRAVAVLMAAVLFALPLAAVTVLTVTGGEEVSTGLKHLIYFYIPIPSVQAGMVWRQLVYTLVVTALASIGAQRLVGRVS